jgi:hypothetical protein
MRKYMRYILLFILPFLFGSAQAQTRSNGDLETIVISEFQPEITRNIQKIVDIPAIRDSAAPAPPINYQFGPRKFETSFEVDPIKPAKMVGEPLNKLYHTYLRGAFGLPYVSLYGEGWYNSGRSKEGSFDIHARHFSSSLGVGGSSSFSGFSEDEMNLAGKKFIGKHTVDGGLDYSRNSTYFYGDDVGNFKHDKDSIHQYFNFVHATVGLLSHYTDSAMINHEVHLGYYYMNDHFKTSENNIRVSGTASRYIHTEQVGVDVLVDYYKDNTLKDTSSATLLKIHPFVAANGEKWQLKAGIAAWTEFSKDAPFFIFLPDAEASYDIYKHIITPYAGINGNMQRNSYKMLTDQNPFLNPNVAGDGRNTRSVYNLYGGLRGSLSAYTAYDAHVSYGRVDNAAFFVNDTADKQHTRYTVVYDDGSLLKMHGEIGYQASDKFRLMVKGDYVRYFLNREIQQWHTPTTRITLAANYNLRDKIGLKLDLFGLNQQFARYFVPDPARPGKELVRSKELGALVDVNLGMEYRYTKFLSGFLSINNIGAVKYYQWNDYPTQRFNVMAGITCIF